jgi:hypothetical protein
MAANRSLYAAVRSHAHVKPLNNPTPPSKKSTPIPSIPLNLGPLNRKIGHTSPEYHGRSAKTSVGTTLSTPNTPFGSLMPSWIRLI